MPPKSAIQKIGAESLVRRLAAERLPLTVIAARVHAEFGFLVSESMLRRFIGPRDTLPASLAQGAPRPTSLCICGRGVGFQLGGPGFDWRGCEACFAAEMDEGKRAWAERATRAFQTCD